MKLVPVMVILLSLLQAVVSAAVPPTIVIDAPDAGITVNESLSRDPKPITFTPTKTGKYPVFCDKKLLFLDSYREKGMEGILEVVE